MDGWMTLALRVRDAICDGPAAYRRALLELRAATDLALANLDSRNGADPVVPEKRAGTSSEAWRSGA